MGWKSTIDISREEAIALIAKRTGYKELNNEQLADLLDELGYGDDIELPYYGYNFNVIEK